MNLVALDMNGVLTGKCLAHVLSEKYARQGMDYWESYRRGELNAASLVRLVGETHRGIKASLMEEEALAIPPAEHSLELMRAISEGGAGFIIASADYGNLVRRTEAALAPYRPLLSFGNEALYDGGIHTGSMQTPVVDGMEEMRRVDGFKTGDHTNSIISVGGDATCIELFSVSNVSIAYNSGNDHIRRLATFCIDDGNLLDVVELLGKML